MSELLLAAFIIYTPLLVKLQQSDLLPEFLTPEADHHESQQMTNEGMNLPE